MRKNLFQSVCDRLKLLQKDEDGNFIVADEFDAAKAVIQHFDLWNQQLEYIEEETPFATPAVFVEFLPIAWRHQGQGVRDATIVINLHVVTRRNMPTRTISQYGADALDFFALLGAVNLCLHNHKGEQFGGLTSVVSTTDNSFDELMHSIEQYNTLVTDTSAHRPPPRTAAAIVIE
ncbi:hypothetical protein MASR1M74_02410 [Lentimicrobium sp.]